MNPFLVFAGGTAVGAVVTKYGTKAVKEIGPVTNSILDNFTKRASALTEKSSDLIAATKQRFSGTKAN